MRALPEFITEIDRVRGTEEIVGADEFATLKNMFRRDREYKVRRYELPDRSTVHAVFFVGKDREGNSQNKLSSYLWHVPEGMEYPIG
jgi:hypothetical protein